jgi:hypothetical protein
MTAAVPFVVSALVGTAVAKVGGSLVAGMTGNKELGNIVGAIGGIYAGGLAGGYANAASESSNFATVGDTASVATGAGNDVKSFGAFDTADAKNLAGSLGSNNATAYATAPTGNVSFGTGGSTVAQSPQIAKSTSLWDRVIGTDQGATASDANTIPTDTGGGGLFSSAMKYAQTPLGMQMVGSTIQGLATGMSKQEEIDATRDLTNQSWDRKDALSRYAAPTPVRLVSQSGNNYKV